MQDKINSGLYMLILKVYEWFTMFTVIPVKTSIIKVFSPEMMIAVIGWPMFCPLFNQTTESTNGFVAILYAAVF